MSEPIWINDIPFLSREPMGHRFIAAFIFFDGDWHAYVPIDAEGMVMKMHSWPAEANYYGTHPEQPTDIATNFLDLISQHANHKPLKMHCAAIVDDIHNLSASLYKFKLIHDSGHDGSSRLAATEIEYLLVVCRSIFDHLQEVLQKFWDSVLLNEKEVSKNGLPPSFAKMALQGDIIRTAEALTTKYGLPPTIAECYPRNAPMFLRIRDFRDALVHHGKPMDYLFKGDDDFLIQKRLGPFKDLDIWDDHEVEENSLAPLFPVLAQVVHGTLAACEDFALAIGQTIALPSAAVPGMRLYVRGYFNEYLLGAIADAEKRLMAGRSIVPD